METTGTLKIQVVEANLTHDTEWAGKMDPYVKLKLNGAEWKS